MTGSGPSESPPPVPPSSSSAAAPKPAAAAAAAQPAQDEDLIKTIGDGLNKVVGVPDWVALHPLLGCYTAEALGTFFFSLTVALVGINNPHPAGRPELNITPIPISFMLMCMVFTFGYISGGHFNPAVTLAVYIAKREDKWKSIGYVICQCGASLGAGIVAMIIEGSDIVVPNVKDNSGDYFRKGMFAELIYTFALATVVLHVACSSQTGNFFYGFAIGMTICAGASAVGGVSGGAFNPAIATGLQASVCLAGKCQYLLSTWLYWVAPCLGAGLASFCFLIMDTGSRHQSSDTAATSDAAGATKA